MNVLPGKRGKAVKKAETEKAGPDSDEDKAAGRLQVGNMLIKDGNLDAGRNRSTRERLQVIVILPNSAKHDRRQQTNDP
jgi:hypothetical protein